MAIRNSTQGQEAQIQGLGDPLAPHPLSILCLVAWVSSLQRGSKKMERANVIGCLFRQVPLLALLPCLTLEVVLLLKAHPAQSQNGKRESF